MIIEKNLPQFNQEKAILIVAGDQTAKIFFAYKSELKELEQIVIPTQSYSDREGSFGRKIKGDAIGPGAVYEKSKNEVQNKFTKQLAGLIDELYKKIKFDSVYLFSPDYMNKEIYSVFSKKISSLVKIKLKGNFVDRHPFILLRMLKKEIDKVYSSSLLAEDEAKKLLDKNIE